LLESYAPCGMQSFLRKVPCSPGPRDSRLSISALLLAVSSEITEKSVICIRDTHLRSQFLPFAERLLTGGLVNEGTSPANLSWSARQILYQCE
jgi:hypothetical protein